VDAEIIAHGGKMTKRTNYFLKSLNLPTQSEVDRLWAKEVERRIAQIERGKVKLVSGEKVFSDLRRKYRR